MLVATALVMVDEEAATLFPRRVVVVSCDRAVGDMARSFGIDVTSGTEFGRPLT